MLLCAANIGCGFNNSPYFLVENISQNSLKPDSFIPLSWWTCLLMAIEWATPHLQQIIWRFALFY